MRMALAGAVALMTLTGLTSAANAQSTPITFNGDTRGEPTWNRLSQGPVLFFPSGTVVSFQAIQVTILNTAIFDAQTSAGFDTFLHLYQGSFDPTDSLTNIISGDDDGGAGLNSRISSAPTLGEYTLVVSGFSDTDDGEFALFLNGVVLGWGPTTADQLNELKATIAQVGHSTLRVRSGNIKAVVGESLATRNATNDIVSQGQTASLAGGVYTWLKASRAYTNDAGRTVNVPVYQFGADIAINESIVAGVALGYSELSTTSPGFAIEGDEVTIQPYIGWDTGVWRGSASLTYGQINYDSITTLAATAAAEGDLWALNANVARDYTLNSGRTITPFAELSVGTVKLTATSGALAGVGLGDRVEYQELRLGSKLSEPMGLGTLNVGLSADYYHTNAPAGLTSTQFDPNGWSATMEVGYGLITSKGMNIDTNLSVSGIGGDATTLTGTIELGFRF